MNSIIAVSAASNLCAQNADQVTSIINLEDNKAIGVLNYRIKSYTKTTVVIYTGYICIGEKNTQDNQITWLNTIPTPGGSDAVTLALIETNKILIIFKSYSFFRSILSSVIGIVTENNIEFSEITDIGRGYQATIESVIDNIVTIYYKKGLFSRQYVRRGAINTQSNVIDWSDEQLLVYVYPQNPS